jgi:polysaccharide export outer membrane protein
MRGLVLFGCMAAAVAGADAQTATTAKPQGQVQATQPPATNGSVPVPAPVVPEFVIGVGDVLSVFIWREPDLSEGAIPVLPDGKISLKLVNNIQAAGLTTTQLADQLVAAYDKFLNIKPVISVTVKQINSRKVCTSGKVNKVGCFDLTGPMDIVTLVAMAGGLQEFADRKNLTLIRTAELRPDGKPWSFNINYEDLENRRKLEQNYQLKPGDVLIVK